MDIIVNARGKIEIDMYMTTERVLCIHSLANVHFSALVEVETSGIIVDKEESEDEARWLPR